MHPPRRSRAARFSPFPACVAWGEGTRGRMPLWRPCRGVGRVIGLFEQGHAMASFLIWGRACFFVAPGLGGWNEGVDFPFAMFCFQIPVLRGVRRGR